MILYLDTSALVKLYVKERESELVRKAIARARAVATHLIAYAEMRAAFGRAQRLGRVALDELPALFEDLDRDWERMDIVGVTEPMVRRAGHLAVQFGLRGYDSVHLAAAESAARQTATAGDLRFVAFDTPLVTAATALGLPVL